MRRRTSLVMWSIVLIAVVVAVATVPLSTGPRAAVLAIAGGLVVVTSESAVSLVRWRRWPSRLPQRGAQSANRLVLRQDLAAAVGLGVVGGASAWVLVAAASAFPGHGWPVVAVGGVAVLTALLAIALAPTAEEAGPGLRSRRRRPDEVGTAGTTGDTAAEIAEAE